MLVAPSSSACLLQVANIRAVCAPKSLKHHSSVWMRISSGFAAGMPALEFQLWDAGSDCWLQGGAALSPLLAPIALCPVALPGLGKVQPWAVPWAGLCGSDLVLIAHHLKT